MPAPTDRIGEDQHTPRPTQSLPRARRVLVFAPHPDDEVYGCGGTLCLWARRNVPITVVVCTPGGEAADPLIRKEESRRAANILGYGPPVFWDLQDRQLRYGEGLVQRIQGFLETTEADWIFVPSLSERHPDHQALSLAVAEAVRRSQGNRTLVFYEVSAPLVPNWLVDISSTIEAKDQAMRCFASQEALNAYRERILGLNRYRGFGGDADCGWAEAFFVVEQSQLHQGLGVIYRTFLDQRAEAGAAVDASGLPLVSVIVRSMDRPCLRDALQSLADQIYPNIELVVVNAKGGPHGPVTPCRPWWKVVVTEDRGPLGRSRAANVGLDHAQGRYLMFLDDDDLLLPDHISRLVERLSAADGEVLAAYAGVRVVDEAGRVLLEYDQPWSFARLLAANYIPNMALLFDRRLVDEKKCRFDESLEVLEDWDFFLQLAAHGDFCHVPGISAVYRYGLGTSGLSRQRQEDYYRVHRARVIAKWVERLGIPSIDESLYVLSQLMDHLRAERDQARAEIQAKESLQKALSEQVDALTSGKASLEQLVQALQQEIAERAKAQEELTHGLDEAHRRLAELEQRAQSAEALLREIYNSRFWRITRPLREVMRFGRSLLKPFFPHSS